MSAALDRWVRPICYCEIDPYCQAILIQRMRNGDLFQAPIWDDIKSLDGRAFFGLVDVIFGGFPCQDISVAGNGKGLEGERSGLFFEIVRLAKEVKPAFIFLENVPAIRTRGLSTVGKELANLGYNCRWGALSAYDVGAPHKRERWFLLAHAKRGELRDKPRRRSWESRQDSSELRDNSAKEPLADAMRERLERWENLETAWKAFAEYGCEGFSRGISGIPKPAICRNDDGYAFRMDRIKCLGNAVVPLQVKTAFERLLFGP